MGYILVKDIYKKTNEFGGKEVQISGWVRTVRASNYFGFIEVNDGSFFLSIQVVFESEVLTNYREIAKLGAGAAIIVKGVLEITKGAKQPFEIKATQIVIEGDSKSDYPLQKKRHTFEYLRTIAHLRPRANAFNATFRVRSVTAQVIHEFFANKGFVYVHTPIITSSDCEGAGEMFQVTTLDLDNIQKDGNDKIDYSNDFFGKNASLTVSGQLAVETYCMAFRNVYTFGPTFRAENSNTHRHASEFWMIEPEIAFADINDDMDLAEEMLKYVFKHVMERCPEEMKFFNKFVDKGLIERLNKIISSDFERITYSNAVEMLEKAEKKFEYLPKWGMDLQTEHERYLTEVIFQKASFCN